MKLSLGVLLTAALLMTGGCQALRGYSFNRWPEMQDYAQRLSEMDRQQLETAFTRIHDEWERHPSADNWARLGLIRGQPGYPDYKPASAVENLRTALQIGSSAWDDATRAYLKQRLDQMQALATLESRLDALEQENEQLRALLTEARDKLQALTDIERDLGSGNKSP